MRDRVLGRVPTLAGFSLEGAQIKGDRVSLKLRGPDAKLREFVADHVIAATGYKPDLSRFQFLSGGIRSKLRALERTPVLTSSMESSVPGLYFIGPITSNSFGPVMRFAFGARFAAAVIARALA